MQIEVKVQGQKIERLNSPGAVEDTLNYLTCYFTFDGEEWDNTVKTAYFRNPASGKTYSQILAEDNTCTVPWEALTDKGFARFSVAGEREDYRITTNVESFCNSGTIYGGNPSEPPTPDQYDQMIALAEQTKEIAESVRRDADEGKFDGDPGEPGKPGAPGRDGVSPTAKVEQTNDGAVITVTDATGTTKAKLKNGKDGNPGQDATDEQVRAAVEAYMKENPIQGDTEDIIKLAIKNEASGAVPITITDSADMGVQDLEMQGWTEQPTYEGTNLFDISAVGLQYDGDTVHVYPENLETSILQNALPGQYTISFRDHKIIEHSPSGDRWTCIFTFYYTDGSKGEMHTYVGTKCTSDAKKTVSSIALRNPWKVVEDISGIMINAGAESLSYEPYTGNAPSPSPEYPQEIVSAGNYDEGTGKYQYTIKISDSEESPTKSQTVTLTADRPLTKFDRLEKRNGVWGWLYNSAEIVLDGSEVWQVYGSGFYTSRALLETYTRTHGVCEQGNVKAYDSTDGMYGQNSIWLGVKNSNIYWNENPYFNVELEDSGIGNWKNHLSQNPAVIWYETTEETFISLSETEQESLNALHTYYPTTMLSNDAGCEMTIKYIADTKAYIDSKIAAIQTAIINTI